MRAAALNAGTRRQTHAGGVAVKRIVIVLVCFATATLLVGLRHSSDVSDFRPAKVAVPSAEQTTSVPSAEQTASTASSRVPSAVSDEPAVRNRSPLFVQPLLPPHVLALLNRADSMVDLTKPRDYDKSRCPVEPNEPELQSNLLFLDFFTKVFREKFDNLPWMLDEGGLIGASRAGAMKNADDDFDFFLILPNNHAPCRPDSLSCSEQEFHDYIHKFLMVFWNLGLCINKFHPDKTKFVSRMRLMYSLQLNRDPSADPLSCFIESKPFAHMHLGMFTEDGFLQTNIWAVHTTHARDKLPLDVLLPTSRCRIGNRDAPCPRNITEFLTIRNRGEYRRRSADGSCLLVKKSWKPAVRRKAVEKTVLLDSCGYNSIVDLVPAYVASDYTSC
jgi:hypothetical protein